MLISNNQNCIGEGRQGSTGVVTQWQQFVQTQVRLHGQSFAGPKLICIDIQPYGDHAGPGVQRDPERRRLQ